MALTRDCLRRLLGPINGSGFVASRTAPVDFSNGGTREEVVLDRGQGPITGTLLRPGGDGPHPAILYCHAHGNAWEIGRKELLDGRPALKCGAYGPVLVDAGFAVLCLDMPGHGDRLAEGTEAALAKAALWHGETLMGRMLGDLIAGLDMLAADPGIDGSRIGAMGLSMGATHAYWLAALDARVAAVAQSCAFADIGPLIAADAHDLHGIYMTVPGLLAQGDMGDVAAMIAPRPQLVGYGARDPLTSEAALVPALNRVRAAYDAAGVKANLCIVDQPDVGHEETPALRAAVLNFLARTIGPQGRGPAATDHMHGFSGP